MLKNQFTWINYPAQYESEIETWCDEAAIRFALDSDSVKTEHQWYLNAEGYTHGSNYFCKIALDGETPVALVMLAVYTNETTMHLTENIVYIDTLIINPALRGQGYGTQILYDIIHHADRLIHSRHNIFVAQIHKDNSASKYIVNKLGFQFICTEAEANDTWFNWIYPASATERFLACQQNA